MLKAQRLHCPNSSFRFGQLSMEQYWEKKHFNNGSKKDIKQNGDSI
jgi:hypothetical protein